MRERPKTIHAYTKSLRSIVAQTMTSGCVWKSNPSRKSLRKLINPARGNGTIPETPSTPILGAFSVWTAKTPRKTPIHRLIHRAWSLTHLVPLTPIKGEAAGAEEAEAEAGVEAEAEATMRKENGIVFSTRKTMTTAQIIVQIRKDSKPFLRRKESKRRERVP
jgi:hypothetical protein